MFKEPHHALERKNKNEELSIFSKAFPIAPTKRKKMIKPLFISANRPIQHKSRFLKKHLHFLGAIFSLIAIIISYRVWQVETQWVVKWMIIYTIFALFYWSIKPLIRRIREKWNK